MKLFFKIFIFDFIVGLKNNRFWRSYAFNELKSKHRRSLLGLFWIIINTFLFISFIGVVLRKAFFVEDEKYLLYLASGYITWIFIQNCVTNSCNILIESKSFLKTKNWPISIFIFKLIYKEIIIFCLNFTIILIFLLSFKHYPGLNNILLIFCSLIITILTAVWISFIVSIACLKFYDLKFFINSIMRLLFFATPIIWFHREGEKFLDLIITFNPVTYFILAIRNPLIGEVVPIDVWIAIISISTSCLIISILIYAYAKDKINYLL